MNILTDILPKKVEIDGYQFEINTDFRAGIAFEMMIQKGEFDIAEILKIYYGDKIPRNIDKAISEAELFYCCGELPEIKDETKRSEYKKQAYSFEVDAKAIFADFWRYYAIDLSQEGLHWWTFRALLNGLPEKSEFKQRAYYRTCDVKGLPKNEKKRVLKIRSMLEIKSPLSEKMTLDERNSKMIEYIKTRQKEIAGGEINE